MPVSVAPRLGVCLGVGLLCCTALLRGAEMEPPEPRPTAPRYLLPTRDARARRQLLGGDQDPGRLGAKASRNSPAVSRNDGSLAAACADRFEIGYYRQTG